MDDKDPAVSLTSCSYSMYPNPLGFPARLVTSRISLILPCCNKKNELYLSVNVFTGPSNFTWSSEPREVQPLARQREYLHFPVILRP